MDVTNRFVLDFARRYTSAVPGARVLDFGCGAGELVAAARAGGLEMLGAEVFYAGSGARAEAERSGRLGSIVHEIHDGRLPFSGGWFDLVTNNQVLEHVDGLEAVLREIHRVLRPGGTVLSIFPDAGVFREGHIGIPFSHWFRKGSRARFYYTWTLRRAGLGTWKEQAPDARQWATDKLRWIDDYTRYRPRKEILETFRRQYQVEFAEPDYVRFRLLDSPGLAPLARLLGIPGLPAIATAIFRRLAFLVIVARKEAA